MRKRPPIRKTTIIIYQGKRLGPIRRWFERGSRLARFVHLLAIAWDWISQLMG